MSRFGLTFQLSDNTLFLIIFARTNFKVRVLPRPDIHEYFDICLLFFGQCENTVMDYSIQRNSLCDYIFHIQDAGI